MATVYRGTESTAAHLPGVRSAVAGVADSIGSVAEALFAPHNHPGRHEISVEHDKLDSLVTLSGPAALTVEFGRSPNKNGRGAMRGLHILGRAAGI